jgi:4-hydroxy-3-polyprenylbenzoate decarboxylase
MSANHSEIRSKLPITVAWTGASGLVYGVRLVDVLLNAGLNVNLMVSSAVKQTAPVEMSHSAEGIVERLRTIGPGVLETWGSTDFSAPMASGSAQVGPMVVVPCSMGTIGRIAAGTSENLMLRSAEVCLKERRKLVVVPRETPLSTGGLENMLKLSQWGVVVMPAAPGFYNKPTKPGDLVDFMVQRICDHIGVEVDLSKRWGG